MAAAKGFGGRMPAKGGAAPARGGSRWGGIPSTRPQTPIPDPGTYRFRIKSGEMSYNQGTGNETVKINLEIVATDCPTTTKGEVQFLAVVSGKAKQMGEDRVRALAMNAMGFPFDPAAPDEDVATAYLEAYPKGEPIDNLLNGVEGDNSLIGRLVDADVTLGNERIDRETGKPTGERYRDYAWVPVAEAEQGQ